LKKNTPKILIAAGEPAGIGLDLCLKLAYKKFPAEISIVGNHITILDRAKLYKDNKFKIITKPNLHNGKGELHVINIPYPCKVLPGKLNKSNSLAQLNGIDFAINECMKKNYDALVTLPVNKKILSSENKKFTGHTEYISKLCGTKNNEVMMLINDKLRVALVTTHIALIDIPKLITKKKLEQTIRVLNDDLKNKFKIKKPRITITGLNPHAGEDGEFGIEEKRIIIPVIKKLTAEGLNLRGPIPADTAFTKKFIEITDSFLAMYHDQGLSPFKALSFNNGVNITLGLPIIRTSVDHGTALDLVGSKNINPSSFFESIDLAINLAKNKKNDLC
tara:strand:- start:1730 stop:2728 length:999 start_codon:yes stop_codon:yes gene_type:complete